LSGKPGNVGDFDICCSENFREFDSYQGNVRELTKSQGILREKSREEKLFIVNVNVMFETTRSGLLD